ncbi:MAG: peroxiredoxin [Polyangiaceae bacterium]|nr:peroxiredoxin [Polyangiaceae bacterium]
MRRLLFAHPGGGDQPERLRRRGGRRREGGQHRARAHPQAARRSLGRPRQPQGQIRARLFLPEGRHQGLHHPGERHQGRLGQLQAAGIEVFGVSTQDAASHQSFIDKHDLPFPLAVDGEAVAKAFGVPLKNGLAARNSFLIGKDGKVIAVWPDVDPAEHADAVLKAAS